MATGGRGGPFLCGLWVCGSREGAWGLRKGTCAAASGHVEQPWRNDMPENALDFPAVLHRWRVRRRRGGAREGVGGGGRLPRGKARCGAAMVDSRFAEIRTAGARAAYDRA